MKIIETLLGFVGKAKPETVNLNPVRDVETRNDGFYQGWIGVDLDGTLARSDRVVTLARIGEPIPKMAEMVRSMIRSGAHVKIFTARAGDAEQVALVKSWLRKNGFPDLEVTNVKDYDMIRLYDDRAVQVIENTGELVRVSS